MTRVRVAGPADEGVGALIGLPAERYPALLPDQEAGRLVLLVAEDDEGAPVGSAVLHWAARDAAARAAMPGCPELAELHVAGPAQGRGHGSALVRAAERQARRAGRAQLGLGVADDNPDAARLYRRLGFRETGIRYVDRWSWTGPDGVTHEIADPVRWLARDVGAALVDWGDGRATP